MVAGDFAAVEAAVDPPARRVLNADAFRTLWSALTQALGPCAGRREPVVSKPRPDDDHFDYPLAFERGQAHLLVVVSRRRGAVTTMRLQPGDPQARPVPEIRTSADLAGVVPDVKGVGLVVGVVGTGDEVLTFGDASRGGVYDIGSITKTFTAIVLADMVVRGEVGLDDPITKYLPSGAAPPAGGESITLRHLATNRSGLPRLPSRMRRADPRNPYADFTEDDLWASLEEAQLEHAPGEERVYSNFGFGLLGRLLAHARGTTYETLVVERVCHPLGMSETTTEPSPSLVARRPQGFRGGAPTTHWDSPMLAGAGALQSTVDDMLRFLHANLDPDATPIAAAIRLAQRSEDPLAWNVRDDGGLRVVWHNGGTGGFHSFLGFAPDARVGVVAMTNCDDVLDAAVMRLVVALARRP